MNNKYLFNGNKNDVKEVSTYLTAIAEELREPFSDLTGADRMEVSNHIQKVLEGYIARQAKMVAKHIKATEDVEVIKNIMATRVLTELEKYNDPEFLDGRNPMSFDTFFKYFIKKPAIKEYFMEKRNLKTYEVDGMMHIEAVKEYLVTTYGADSEAISARDIFIHQGESGRRTNLSFSRIQALMDIMNDPARIENEEDYNKGEYDPGLMAIEKEETAKELADFMKGLGRIEKTVFLLRFPDDEQLSYKDIGCRRDMIDFCKSCRYKKYVVDDNYIERKFLEDQYRGVVRKLRRFISENELSAMDLLHCIGLVIDKQKENL